MAPSNWARATPLRWPSAAGAALARGWREDADRRPLWLPVGLGIGIALYFALPSEPAIWLG
ncbi:MAG: hypothetical protein KGQ94_15450, partial [Alphaproteobacteria bacterium]|nr:hypothetical protein [Alphaproteobacteria bacterium]